MKGISRNYTKYYFKKTNVEPGEYTIHDIVYRANIVNVPNPYSYDKNIKTLVMRRIPGISVSDMYGENFEDVPTRIIEQIRNIIATLYNYGVEYPDITGYNFMEYQNKVWIIDFGHAKLNTDKSTYDPFIWKFIEGHKDWNPDYK